MRGNDNRLARRGTADDLRLANVADFPENV
jgi:hypothetical protein